MSIAAAAAAHRYRFRAAVNVRVRIKILFRIHQLIMGSIGPADPIRILTLSVSESIDALTPIRSSG
jgi:hypothetical protein